MKNNVIIDFDSKPNNTIFYYSGCIIYIMKNEGYLVNDLEGIFENVKKRFNSKITRDKFLLTLNYLFLIDKIVLSEDGGIQLCSSNN